MVDEIDIESGKGGIVIREFKNIYNLKIATILRLLQILEEPHLILLF
mgnify:CR=1 FL=1